MNSYTTYKNYMLNNYNHALFSIPIDLDFSCPNREKDGSKGCTFCPPNGARAIQSLDADNIEEQISQAISFAQKRYNAKKFMLYIQAYTGTFTSLQIQKEIYSKLLKMHQFEAISIGTRPDCLDIKTVQYLQELNQQIDVHIDLGVQTFNDTTLKMINRGHNSQCSIEAIKRLKEHGIKVFAHIIVGFENEKREDWLNSVKQLVKLNVDGIKIHNLHIIKDTLLCQSYKEKSFKTFNEYEYAEELIYLIRNIPSHIPIIRISTDSPDDTLIAPIWHMQKGQFSQYVNEQMGYRDLRQGDLIETIKITHENEKIIHLEDGSVTVFDKKYKDYYHAKSGAYKQADELFLKNSKLSDKLKIKNIKLLDIGFGMGYNSLCAIALKKSNKLEITALDKNRNIIQTSYKNIKNKNEANILKQIYENSTYLVENNQLKLILGDIRYTLTTLKDTFDIIFLDPFIHTQNASMISVDVFKLLHILLKDDGVLICSNSATSTQVALSQSCFKSTPCNIENSDIKGLIAVKGTEIIEGVAHKDPYLVYRDKQLLVNREEEIHIKKYPN